MKVVNKTKWNTRDLKRIFVSALNENNKVEGKYFYDSTLTVEVVYSNGLGKDTASFYKHYNIKPKLRYTGCAYLNRPWMRLRIPRENVEPKRLARVFIHELDHVRGYRHPQMLKSRDVDVSWLNDNKYPVRIKGVK